MYLSAAAPDLHMTLPVESSAAAPNASRRPGQFSLRRLLLAFVAVSVVLALINVTWRYRVSQAQLREQAEELAKLRAEAGYLVVGDRRKVHVLSVPVRSDDSWKWKIYLPPQSHWQMRTQFGKIPSEGLAGLTKISSTTERIAGGELTVQVFLERSAAGDGNLDISVTEKTGTGTRHHHVPAEVVKELFSTGGRTIDELGKPVAATVDADGPVELLRVRRGVKLVSDAGNAQSYEVDDNPSGGLLIWLEPAP